MTEFGLDLGGARVAALDGGTMTFPVTSPRGYRKRLRLAVRPVLVVAGTRSVLVDAGFGPADPKRREKFGLRDPAPLERQCRDLGLRDGPDVVLLTHLHFDHAGGALAVRDGVEELRFPRARLLVHQAEWRAGLADGRGGGMAERIQRAGGGTVELLRVDEDVVPGVTIEHAPGHTEGLCLVHVRGRARCVVATDSIPTRRFLVPRLDRLADQDPERALAVRVRTLEQAARDRAWLAFYHDTEVAFGRVGGLKAAGFTVEPA